ncbi:MAG: RNA polymerase sigma factor [Oscillospiraceae bacterium]
MLLLLTAFGSPLTAADAEHIDRCIAEMSRGDTGALAKVYERPTPLYGFSLFLKNPQDAEDAVQETFAQYQSAAQYRPGRRWPGS